MEYQIPCEVCQENFTPDGRRKRRCSKTHTRNCATCAKTFTITANVKSDKTFCSKICRGQSQRRINTCVICDTKFHKISKTCSQKCANKLKSETYSTNAEKSSCPICETEFIPSSPTQKYCANIHKINCGICDSEFIIADPLSKRKYCSSACASLVINSEESNIKRGKTSLVNFGTEKPQNTAKMKQSIIDSNLKNYGVEHPMMLEEFKNKRNKTNQEKYGYEHTLQVPKIRKKIEETNIERYGTAHPSHSPGPKRTAYKTFSNLISNIGVSYKAVSQINRNFAELLKTLPFVETVEFEASFDRFQADLRVNGSLLIDINPTVSHNSFKSFGCVINGCDDTCDKHKKLAKNYHYNRAVAALNNNQSLIQLYDWDSEESILKMVKAKLDRSFTKHSARKLSCKKIPQNVANRFLLDTHIQGRANSQSHCYGLFSGEELLAVATFGKSRFNKKYEYEFIRYAVKSGVIIHGGAGRLFKEFLNDANPLSVISYVNFDHTTKVTFLNSLGFEESKHTGPSLVYCNVDGRKYSNTSLLSVGADILLKTNYGSAKESGLDNHAIMLLEGFLPVYTSGNRVFIWNN